jgi:lipid-binding SYLF domain-containing protein
MRRVELGYAARAISLEFFAPRGYRMLTHLRSFVGLWLVLISVSAAAGQGVSPQQILRDATRVITETRELRVQAIPDSLLKDAQAVAIIPNVVRVGLIVGGRHGRGILVIRQPDGAWSAPSFIEISGGSIGWQVGVQSTDVVLVFKNRQGIDSMLQGNKFTLGADAAIAAGPLGRQASAATDAQLRAQVLSYSRSRGLFAGVALDGSVLSVDAAANAAFAQGGAAAAEDTAALITALTGQLTPVEPTTTATPMAAPSADDLNITGDQQKMQETFAKLSKRLDAAWRDFLTPPPAFYAEDGSALAAATELLARYDRVASDQKFEALFSTEEFQAMHALIGRYVAELQELGQITLPPPPTP